MSHAARQKRNKMPHFSLDSVHCASKYSSQFNQLKTEESFLDLFSDSTIKVFWKAKAQVKRAVQRNCWQ